MDNVKLIAIGALSLVLIGIFAVLYPTYQISSGAVGQLSSYQDLKNFLNNSLTESSGFYGGFGGIAAPAFGGVARSMESTTTAAAVPGEAAQAPSDASEDYSQTNVQIAGVDEPDIVKNDGKYIYTVSGTDVVIVDAYPASGARILSKIGINGTVGQLFVNKDKLVIFSNVYNYPVYAEGGGGIVGGIAPTGATEPAVAGKAVVESSLIYPYPYYTTQTFIGIYDISDRSNPVLKRNITIDGDFLDARMIGDYIYPIVVQPINYYGQGDVPIPRIYTGGVSRPVFEFPNLYYFDNPDYSYRYTTVMAVNTQNDGEEATTKVYLMGYSQNIFVSQDNIYITYTKQLSYSVIYNRLIDEVFIPNLPSSLTSRITQIRNSYVPSYQKYQEIQQVINEYYETLNPEERAVFQRNLETKIVEFYVKIQKETEKTVIHKIAISGNNIQYITSGEAPGYVLNQFSMDENGGYFRIATTTREYVNNTWQSTTKNHIYVLDGSLNIVGKLEDLAPGETIFSARFLGNRAYLVTFRRIDPLFVIDLSNPSDPKVLGKLKIPGFSDYLHPYDDNHIIGVGKETEEIGTGRVITTGVKLALFDVTNPENPIEISKYVIGESGTDSYALYDHKAFLFSKSKNLLIIPILLSETNYYYTFQGAYVFNLDLQNGFVLKGKITHLGNETEAKNYYYYYSPFSVKRSLYIGDTLYTVSDKVIKMNSLDTLEEKNKIVLPYNVTQYYYPYIY